MVQVELRNAIIGTQVAKAIKSAPKKEKVKVATIVARKVFKKIEARKK